MKFLFLILFLNQVLSQDIGQKMYNNGDSESAINYYEKLLSDNNLSKDDLVYNLATIYSSLDSLNKAKKYFNLAEQDSLNPSSELKYNYGNMLYNSLDLEGSLIAYRQSLIKNPLDNDARMNYEFVKNEIKKNKQNQKKDQNMSNESEDSENNDDNNNDDDKNQSNKNKDNKSNKSEENPEKNSRDKGPTNQELSNSPQQENNKEREISIDQSVENILNAMKENEKVNKKRKQKNYSNDGGKQW